MKMWIDICTGSDGRIFLRDGRGWGRIGVPVQQQLTTSRPQISKVKPGRRQMTLRKINASSRLHQRDPRHGACV